MREYARLQTAILLRRLAFQVNRAARSDDQDTIHDLRVSIRRLSACLRVFRQFFPSRPCRKVRGRLSELMHAAGRVRDRDIAIALLVESGAPRRSAAVRRVEAERRDAGAELAAGIQRWRGRNFSRKWRVRLEL
jgi:CHAD domain-containing protein